MPGLLGLREEKLGPGLLGLREEGWGLHSWVTEATYHLGSW